MAEHEIELTFKWENRVGFELTAKRDQNPVVTVIRSDENECMPEVWPAIANLVQRHIKFILGVIGKDMIAP